MYHALWPGLDDPSALEALWAADPQLRDPGARRYALDVRTFHRQMRQVAAAAPPAGASRPASWAALDDPASRNGVWITFDDGHVSNADLAWPVLRELGLGAILFITTDWIGTPGFMSAAQIRELRAGGLLIGAHGCSHRFLSDLDETEARRELVESRGRLEDILGESVAGMALPGGRNHPRLRKLAADAGYRHLFTSRIALARAEGDPLDWPRVPITNVQPADFLPALLSGDARGLHRMARNAAIRGAAKRMLGNRLYERLRGLLLRD